MRQFQQLVKMFYFPFNLFFTFVLLNEKAFGFHSTVGLLYR